MKYILRVLVTISLAGLIPSVVEVPLAGQGSVDVQPAAPPMLPVGFMHGVPKDFPVILGPIEIRTGDVSLDAKQDTQGPDPAVRSTQYWLQSPGGVVRYFSADHGKVLWEGTFKELKVIALLSETSDGKHHVSIPVGSLWASSLSIDKTPAVSSLIGSAIATSKFAGGFWNAEKIEADYNPKSEVSSQAGIFRFLNAQKVTIPTAKLAMPSCHIEASVQFTSMPQRATAFDMKLGEESFVLRSGRFSSAGLIRQAPTRLDCKDFHAVLANIVTGSLTAEVSPTDVSFVSTITAATGSFLANIGGAQRVPAIGRGRLAVSSLRATTQRMPDAAIIDDISVTGLSYVTSVPPTVTTFRALANDVGGLLALPDFLSPEQQQLKAITDTAAALRGLSATGSDVLVHVPRDEINFLVAGKLNELGVPNAISFGFGKQEILAFVPGVGAHSPISLVLHMAVSIEDTDVSIRPSVSFAPLNSFASTQIGPGRAALTQIEGFLVARLPSVINPLRRLDTDVKVPIPTNDTYPLDLTNTITDPATKATISITATKTKVAVSIPQKAVLIDSDGLHLLLHVDVN